MNTPQHDGFAVYLRRYPRLALLILFLLALLATLGLLYASQGPLLLYEQF